MTSGGRVVSGAAAAVVVLLGLGGCGTETAPSAGTSTAGALQGVTVRDHGTATSRACGAVPLGAPCTTVTVVGHGAQGGPPKAEACLGGGVASTVDTTFPASSPSPSTPTASGPLSCTVVETPPESPVRSPAPGSGLEAPCALVTGSEASAVLGVAVSGTESFSSRWGICSFVAPAVSGVGVTELALFLESPSESVASERAWHVDVTPVEGLAPEAYSSYDGSNEDLDVDGVPDGVVSEILWRSRGIGYTLSVVAPLARGDQRASLLPLARQVAARIG